MSYMLVNNKLDKITKTITTHSLKQIVTNLAEVFNNFPPQMIPDDFACTFTLQPNTMKLTESVHVHWNMNYSFPNFDTPAACVELKLITTVDKNIGVPSTVAEGRIMDFFDNRINSLINTFYIVPPAVSTPGHNPIFFTKEELQKMLGLIAFIPVTANLAKVNFRPICEKYNYMYEFMNKKYNLNVTSPFTLEEWDSYE